MTKYDKELDTRTEEYEDAMKPGNEAPDRRETREKEQPEPRPDQPAEKR